jgi:hypothetical protein
MDVVEKDVNTSGELTTGKTEWNGGASLGRSRLVVPGCSTNMMMMVVMVVVVVVEFIKAGTRL